MGKKVAAILSLAIIVMITIAGLNIMMLNDDSYPGLSSPTSIEKGNAQITLNCTLSNESGLVLPILGVKNQTITTSSDAKNWSVKVFQEYQDRTFSRHEHLNEFLANVDMNNNSWIIVYETGGLLFTKDSRKKLAEYSEFNDSQAISIASGFIKNHGGLDGAKLESVHPIKMYDDNDTFTGKIRGYLIYHRFSYNDTTISGGDMLMLMLDGDGEVITFFRMKREVSEELDGMKLISARKAFESFESSSSKLGLKGSITVNAATLCYFTSSHRTIQDKMYPAWKFSYNEENLCFHVNAISGEILTA